MKKFVLAATPRSGSNYVVETLNLHPDVLCHYELARPKEVTKALHLQDKLTLELRKEDPQSFVDLAFTPSKNQSAVGFKIFIHDDQNIFDIILKNNSVRFIVLERENRLAAFSSQEIAMQTNVWGSIEERGPEQKAVVFDSKKFSNYCIAVDKYYRDLEVALKHNGHKFFKIEYMNIKDPQKSESIFKFLGVEGRRVGAPIRKKQNSPCVVNRFTNSGDVLTYLEGIDRMEWANETLE